MKPAIKNSPILVFLLVFVCPIFGMKKHKTHRRSTLHVTFAKEDIIINNEIDNQSNVKKIPIHQLITSRKEEDQSCVCCCGFLCMNCMIAGACSCALGLVMYFSNPDVASQLYEQVNKTL